MKHIWDEVLYYNSIIKQQREIAAKKEQKPSEFQIGDLVWLYVHQKKKGLSLKLMHLWHGPYQIVELTSPVNAKLQTMNSRKMKQIVHVSRLRKYITPVRPTEEPEWIEDDDFNWEQEVAHIKDKGHLPTMEMPAATQSTIEEVKEVDMEFSKKYEVQSITDI